MNKLKIYLRTKGDIQEMIEAYQDAFPLKIIKKSFLNKQDIELNDQKEKNVLISYAYLNLFDDISLMIARYKDTMPSYGYSHDTIIYLSNNDLFDQTYQSVSNSKYFKIDYQPRKFEWGTTLFKAYDKWNNGWVFETRAK